MQVFNRKKNVFRNVLFGFLYKAFSLLMPFVLKTVIIYIMGVQYLGLDNLFYAVFQVLNLTELGVGSAMVYTMYKPVIADDTKRINALLLLYRKYYRIIGVAVLALGLCVVPFLQVIVKSDVPEDVNIYILYFMNLAATVLSYWLFAYRTSILQAYQRDDVISKVLMILTFIKYALQITAIVTTKNYYLYLIINIVYQISVNLISALVSKKLYPQFCPKGKLDRSEVTIINHRIRDLFASKIAEMITGPTSAIIVSTFFGLSVLALYQNYYSLVACVSSIIFVIMSSCKSIIGNSIITETQEKNYHDLKKFIFLVNWVITICASCMLTCMQPFMNLWLGEACMLDYMLVILLAIMFYFTLINTVMYTYKEASGIWRIDRTRTICVALFNVVASIILVQFMGYQGVVVSTILSYVVVSIPWIICNLFNNVFGKDKIANYVRLLVLITLVAALAGVASCLLCMLVPQINLVVNILINLCISTAVSSLFVVVAFGKTKLFHQSLQYIKDVIQSRKGSDMLQDEAIIQNSNTSQGKSQIDTYKDNE